MTSTSDEWRQFSNIELERQYQSSNWVTRVAPSEAVQLFVNVITEQTKRARASLSCELNVRYGPGPEQRYNILGTDVPDDAPLAVFIHGGYWQEMCLDNSDGMALSFHQLGWRTITVGYDLAPAVTMDTIVQQVREAGQRILQLSRSLGSRSILLFGHSAGAHLIAMLLADWSTLPPCERPLAGAAVYMSGIFDLEPLLPTTINHPLNMDVACAKRNSPLLMCDRLTSPSGIRHLVVCGGGESAEMKRQSVEFARRLKAEGGQCSLSVVTGRDHFDLCEHMADVRSDVMKTVLHELQGVPGVGTLM